jgi:hypothetical protein
VKLNLVVLVLALLTYFTACRPVENTGEKYYNLDSLFQSQTKLLIASKAKLTKTATLGEKKEMKKFSPDSLGWIDEFGTLSELALINKPTYRGLYLINDAQDLKSNLRVLSYSLKKEREKEEKIPVRNVKIYYLGSLDRIKRIEGLYNEENELYHGSHHFSIELQDVYNKNMITSYSITGEQKMILADSVAFSVHGQVGFN